MAWNDQKQQAGQAGVVVTAPTSSSELFKPCRDTDSGCPELHPRPATMSRFNKLPRRLAVTIAMAFIGGACIAQSGIGKPCAWRVVSSRAAGPGDTAFVERHPMLAEPEDPTNAAGPGSLRLLSVKTPQHTRDVYLFDQHTGDSTLIAKHGSMPRFSPDGRYVAFSLWKSIDRPWNLVIYDRKIGRRIEPALGGCVTFYWRWSPDGRWLAVQDNPCKRGRCRLCLVNVPSGAVRCIDSLDVFADYEFGWSPNSKHLAVVRPERINPHSEEPSVADLWILSDFGRGRCNLGVTPEYIEREPMWVTDSTILVERYKARQLTQNERVLLQIKGGRP
jgi:dipeptidyl aminopeptidase/acylaminoacyl peptidase